MQHNHPSPFLQSIPLFVAYIAYPFFFFFLSSDGTPHLPELQWFTWTALAVFPIFYGIFFGFPGQKNQKVSPPANLIGAFSLILLCFLTTAFFHYMLLPVLMKHPVASAILLEASPVACVLFGLLWCLCFGIPTRRQFVIYGTFLTFFIYYTAVWTIDTFHPTALLDLTAHAGGAKTISLLLLISLGCSIPEKNMHTPWYMHICRAVLIFGVILTLHRPALFLMAWIILAFSQMDKKTRFIIPLFILGVFAATYFLVTDQTLVLERIINRFYWYVGTSILFSNPTELITGFPLGEALPIDARYLLLINLPTQGLGVTVADIPIFWLRFMLTWGVPATLALLFLGGSILYKARSAGASAVTAAMIFMGLTQPVFYAPEQGIPLLIALFAVFAADRIVSEEPPNETKEDVAPTQGTENEETLGDVTLNSSTKEKENIPRTEVPFSGTVMIRPSTAT
ncbi:MAG: hypothetical protein ACNI27_01205 [Desulfovibrio sp.]